MGGSKAPSFSLLKLISEVTNEYNIQTVNEDDAAQLARMFIQKIKDLDEARRGIHSDSVEVDPRGRITLPKQYRTLMSMHPGIMVEVFPYPQKDPKGLMLKVKK